MERNTIVRATNLHKSFGNLEILKGINLEVEKGEIVAIIGASGAGKTTLLHILGTLDAPNSGLVEIDRTVINDLKSDVQADFRNQKIGFVFQSHQLLPEFTAQENVAIPAMISGKSKKEAMILAKNELERLNMGHRLTHKPAQLSGGEKQRVAVARALINSPLLILADEPTGALDSDNRKELHLIFQQLNREEGHTFIIVSHDPEISEIATRIIRIEDGIIKEREEQ